jgi:hypothetical protein
MGVMSDVGANPGIQREPVVGVRAVLALALIGMLFVGVLISRGEGGPWSARAMGVLFTSIDSGWAPLLYMIGSLGLGRAVRGWLGAVRDRWVIELGVGFTLMLSLTHLLGVLGLLTTLSAWALTLVGVVLLIPDLRRVPSDMLGRVTLSPISVAIVCSSLLALVMSLNPAGMLWGSEYSGFDALSYHLQLPREWIEHGRIWPSDHNVYSYLPGYIEGAYAHMALLSGGGMPDHAARASISAQLLSVLMLVLSAGAIGTLCSACVRRYVSQADQRTGSVLAAVLTLSTPWLLVVGTIAYNEMAVVLLGACALLVAISSELPIHRRAMLTALLVGGACSCKPTAIFLLAPAVGIVLLASAAPKRWIMITVLCVVIGALTISPWLIRNALGSGNPVFPQLPGVFGLGHWSVEQHGVYASAHRFKGSLIDRVGMLVLPDPDGMDHVSRFRGLTNLQWGLTPLLALFGLLTLLFTRSTRRLGMVAALALGLVVLGWVLLTHLQSRFLIPLAPLLIPLGAIGVAGVPSVPVRRAMSRVLAIGALTWCVGFAMLQGRGNPFSVLDLGPGVFLGDYELANPPWTATLNRLNTGGGSVYLLGDATPFYVRGDVRYNSVYDCWLIEDVIATHPDKPSEWTQALRAEGIGLVVVSFSEIERYARSGWLPGSIDLESLIRWIESLGEPIEVWSDPRTDAPLRAIFRISGPTP